MAAPSSPRPKPKIRIGSRIAAAMPAPSVTYMARRASPTPRRMPVVHMPSATIGVDGTTICRKRVDSSSVWPVAPRSRTRSCRKGQTAADKAAVISPMNTSDAPPMRAASSRSPRPRQRETSALQAMVKPMATEMVKNSSVDAKPTAAASSDMPSIEM